MNQECIFCNEPCDYTTTFTAQCNKCKVNFYYSYISDKKGEIVEISIHILDYKGRWKMPNIWINTQNQCITLNPLGIRIPLHWVFPNSAKEFFKTYDNLKAFS